MMLLPDNYRQYNAPGGTDAGDLDFDGRQNADDMTAAEIFEVLPRDIQDEIIDEAEQVAQRCANQDVNSQFYDCECIAARFIDARVLRGPEISAYSLVAELEPECVNSAGVAGYAYNQCSGMNAYGAQNAEEVCSCYGNYVAKQFSKTPVASFSFFSKISANAIIACKRDIKAHENLD